MMDDSYTYEDYLSDFELDYLGFSREPVPNSSEEITEKEPDKFSQYLYSGELQKVHNQ